ncbi:MAG: cobalamin-binding protein [Candidatus Methylomirabilia bacterium]
MTGREIRVDSLPRKIISLAPSLTEVVYALRAQELLAGVTTLCDYPPEAVTKPKVGGIVNPSLEAIVSLKPDLVLATTEGNRARTVKQLSGLGIPTYVVSPKNFSGVLESIARIGGLIGRAEAARRLVGELKERAERVMEALRGRPKPRVLYLVWAEPVIAPGRNTLVTDLIRMAGGASLSGEAPIEWPRLSLEEVVAAAPDLILVATHSAAQGDDALRRWREQGILLPAFESGRVHAIDGDLVHRPGPRIVDGLEVLARAIHPGALP